MMTKLDSEIALEGPHVEVFQYLVYNGDRARERALVWMYAMVNAKGERRIGSSDDWTGHENPDIAIRIAMSWSEFTGWPLVNRGRVEELDEPLRERGRR